MKANWLSGVVLQRSCSLVLGAALLLAIAASWACSDRGESASAEATRAQESTAPILLFNGKGASAGDVAAFETILSDTHLDYVLVNSSRLNEMSEAQLRQHRLLIIPGGNFIDMGNGLSASAAANLRNAVHEGLNYLGVCAGAFLAGDLRFNSLNLTSGVRFGFYSAENRGIRKTAVAIASPRAATLDQYWEDGPQLTGWGEVVGKYPDGTPAVVEGTFGSGWVILAGVHPEAPDAWRRGMVFTTPASEDHAYAGTLINAALNRTALPHY